MNGACFQSYDVGSNLVIANNTFADCSTSGILFGAATCGGGNATNLFIANNIIYGSTASAGAIASFCGSGTVSMVTITNNLEFANGAGDSLGSGAAPQPTNGVAADPSFVNAASPAAGGDFHVRPGSPAFDAGTPMHAPALDLDGRTRPSPPSIGAYD